ncbi:MAG: 4Fe-4S binding protein [Candidatus Omnitrophica bacterium]|nr:4Fe-4S binding protein [Candidatus Omnitrophota bacterium]
MAKRKIIKINEKKCNGCGLCIPSCPEGALQIIDGKARLISDLFCDGLGACIGHCPEGAITIEERESGDYNEKKVMENIVKQGKNVIKAHLEHIKGHNDEEHLQEAIDFLKEKGIEIPAFEEAHSVEHSHPHGAFECPGSKVMEFAKKADPAKKGKHAKGVSELRQWPVQIMLVPPQAPYFKDADLLVAADCVPFAYADFHQDLLRGKVLLIGCPKLDDAEFYKEKISQIFKQNNIKSVTCAHMEVPCCFGLVQIIKEALKSYGKEIPFRKVILGIKGDIK